MLRSRTFIHCGLCATALVATVGPARAEVKKPDCAAIEPWALTIDSKDRWNPNPAQKRFWLPSAFKGAEFEALFGAPATAWTLDDVNAIRPLLQNCAREARKAKRIDAQKAFNAARGFVSGNLKNYVVQTARTGATIDKNLDALLDLPDSPQMLQVLAVLRAVEAGDKNALRRTQQQIAQIGGAEAKAARQIINSAYRQTPKAYAADTLPRLEERYQALRSTVLDEAEDRLTAHGAGPAGLADIDSSLAGVRDEFGTGLSQEDYAQLEQVATAERAALHQEILTAANARIDGLAAEPASIAGAADIVAEVSPSLDGDSRSQLQDHAAARQRAIAGEVLTGAEGALAEFPETLAGIEALDAHVAKTVGAVTGHVGDDRIAAFRAKADARRGALAKTALPEFERRIAGLGDEPPGLAALDKAAAKVAAWPGLAPEVRGGYDKAVAERRAAMETAIAAAAAEREQARQRRVVTATKARIDGMAPRFRSLKAIPAEVEAARGKGLDPAAMQEIETHAAARRQAIADEILAQGTTKLGDVPESFEGLGQLVVLIETVIEETEDAASPAALKRFEEHATDASSRLGRKMLDGFEKELEALDEDREGLDKAENAVAWAKGWRHVDEDVRDDYLEAARDRRDEIAERIAAAEKKRRERVIAAGGDPDIVGYTFADGSGMSTLEFADEKRVIFAVLGMRFGGKYEVVKDDIFVEGPNGTIVFARDGNKLNGMGLSLVRVEK